MLSGLGDVYAKTTQIAGGLTAQRMIELFLFDFQFNQESDTREAQAFTDGVLRTKSSAESSVTSDLVISTQFVDWAQMGFSLNAFPITQTSVVVPVMKRVTVPAASPYEISDAAITAGNTNGIFVYVNARGAWGEPGYLPRAGGAPSAGQVQVNTSTNKLIFNAAQAGATVTYTVPETHATIQSYGGPGTPDRYGKLEFWGKLYTPESTDKWLIYFPELTRKGRPSINLSDDVPTLEMTFSAATPSGWSEPFAIYNLDTAA